MHKHWKDYLGYKDTWFLSATCGEFFCSESILYNELHIPSVIKYPDLPTDSLLTVYEFLSLLDTDLWNQFKTEGKDLEEKESVVSIPVIEPIKTAIDNSKSFPVQPDFSASELIILKHLLDSNIKFDFNDFIFYRSIFQLGYDFATITRVY